MKDQPTGHRRVTLRSLVLGLLAAVAALGLTTPARAQASSDVTVFGPSLFSTASPDEQIRFAWLPDNGQDFFRVVFSRKPSSGWQYSPYETPETVLYSKYASPQEIGLTPGRWYWRVCYGWNDDPSRICYMDDDVRTLDVEEPPAVEPPPVDSEAPALWVSRASAISATKRAVRQRYHVRSRVRCARFDRSEVRCRASFRHRGRATSRLVTVWSDATGVYYYLRK